MTTTVREIRHQLGGTAYTTGRNTKGQFANVGRVTVTVTPRGHWYRSDDPRDVFTNDTVCRGCLHHGHFDYILDYRPCAKPATDADIVRVLAERSMVKPLVAIRR